MAISAGTSSIQTKEVMSACQRHRQTDGAGSVLQRCWGGRLEVRILDVGQPRPRASGSASLVEGRREHLAAGGHGGPHTGRAGRLRG